MRLLWLFPPVIVIGLFGTLTITCLWLAVHRPTRRLSWLRRTLLVALMAIMTATPAVPAPGQPQRETNVEAYFVVDTTGSMAAEDYNGSAPRLEGVRKDLNAITAALAGSRFAIIGWNSVAVQQLPLSTDARAVTSWTDTVRQEVTDTSTGSDLAAPLKLLKHTLENSQLRNPQNVRIVFFLSDGEVRSAHTGVDGYKQLRSLVDGGFVLGYGTEVGGRMKLNDGIIPPALQPNYIIDPATNREAISKLESSNLQAIAKGLGINYMHRTAPDNASSLVSTINIQEKIATAKTFGKLYRQLLWPFAIAFAVLLAWEVWQMPRRHRPRKRSAAPKAPAVPRGPKQ